MTNKYCVYIHLKPSGEVFYVGVSCNTKRPYSKHDRNKFWHNIISKYPNYEVQIIKKNINKQKSYELESVLIEWYGRRDLNKGSLVNMTNGGEGLEGFIPSEKQRKNQSEKMKGSGNPMFGKTRTKEFKENISKQRKGSKGFWFGKIGPNKGRTGKLSPLFGIEKTKLHKEKISFANKGKLKRGKNPKARQVINTKTNKIYSCIKDASEGEHIKYGTLCAMLNGANPNKTNLKYY